MLGFFVTYTDDCTYSYDSFLFALDESKITSEEFRVKLFTLYPNTDKEKFLEYIIVTNACGDKYPVRIENVNYFS